MKIMLIGRQGQVGWELNRCLRELGQVVALDRADFDLARPAEMRDVIRRTAPNFIFNAAAYTAVDRAESDEENARAINAEAVAVLAEEALRCNALLVHYSTDYVFDGSKSEPYVESDATCPINTYGRTKLAGEEAIRSSGAAHLILRTSWVYSARGSNFLLTMLRLMQERKTISVVDDQFGSPTWARSIAEASTRIAASLIPGRIDQQELLSGTYHMTSRGATTWHGFATQILAAARNCQHQPALLIRQINAVSTNDYGSPVPRPQNSILSNRALALRFGVEMPAWDDALNQCMQEIESFKVRRQIA